MMMNHLSRIFLYFLWVAAFALARSPGASAYDFSYAGRLVDDAGAPIKGPVAVSVRFFETQTSSEPLGNVFKRDNVDLIDGIFQLTLIFDAEQQTAIFGDGTRSVFIEVEANRKIYPRQSI